MDAGCNWLALLPQYGTALKGHPGSSCEITQSLYWNHTAVQLSLLPSSFVESLTEIIPRSTQVSVRVLQEAGDKLELDMQICTGGGNALRESEQGKQESPQSVLQL